jgi:putative CocE/NonD family hydrolase
VQDTRDGSPAEEDSDPYWFEREDGYDSVEWAARLPGSNGRVGMYGCSYMGYTQWAAALERPPSLAAIAPGLTWSDPMDGAFMRGGALELGRPVMDALLARVGVLARLPPAEEERARRIAAVVDDFDRLAMDGMWDLPVDDMAVLRRHDALIGLTRRTLSDPDLSSWCRIEGGHEDVRVPSFNIAGWYDVFLQGTLDNYTTMAASGRSARLVVGPWTHETFTDPVGELSFGLRSSRQSSPVVGGGNLDALQLAWFHRQLGSPDARGVAAPETPVRIFVMGRNEWRDEDAWPLERARAERWFLGGGGVLHRDVPDAVEASTEFRYDPADPVPTHGGNLLIGAAFPFGPFDQARVEAREDVLVFTSEPLAEELEVTGRVRLVVYVESSAPSTDWVGRLCDVHPDGRSFNLCDGIARIAEGANACQRAEVDLWSTSNVFLRGHRLRVHVTSSSFPRWDRNLNTGDQRAPRHEAARQRVFHDAQRPSHIELSVVTD